MVQVLRGLDQIKLTLFSERTTYLTVPPASCITNTSYNVSQSNSKRKYLASFYGRSAKHANRFGSRDRRILLVKLCQQIQDENPRLCYYNDGEIPGVKSSERESNRNLSLSIYSTSTFCLMPPGDWPSRIPAMVDCMLMGGIPVLYDIAQMQLWPEHWNWNTTSIFIENANDTFRILRDVSKKEIHRMRHSIALDLHHLLYGHNVGEKENQTPQLCDAWCRIEEYALSRKQRYKPSHAAPLIVTQTKDHTSSGKDKRVRAIRGEVLKREANMATLVVNKTRNPIKNHQVFGPSNKPRLVKQSVQSYGKGKRGSLSWFVVNYDDSSEDSSASVIHV